MAGKTAIWIFSFIFLFKAHTDHICAVFCTAKFLKGFHICISKSLHGDTVKGIRILHTLIKLRFFHVEIFYQRSLCCFLTCFCPQNIFWLKYKIIYLLACCKNISVSVYDISPFKWYIKTIIRFLIQHFLLILLTFCNTDINNSCN